MLVYHSPFFAAALEGQFKEANSLKMTLPEDRPLIFEIFVKWLYLGPLKPDNGKAEDDDIDEADDLVLAWVLGDKLGCPLFQDHVILQLIEFYAEFILGPFIIKTVYENTVPASKLRLWLINSFLYQSFEASGVHKALRDTVEGIEEFSMDVVKAISAEGRQAFKDPRYDPLGFLLVVTPKEVERIRKEWDAG